MLLFGLLTAFFVFPYYSSFDLTPAPTKILLESKQISLENRQPNSFVNGVFKDNILLNLAYMDGRVVGKEDIDWNIIREPFISRFKLLSGETFAFHEDVYEQYRASLTLTSGAHFNYQEGFKSDGYLMGNGICHLASLIYWAAKDAGLEAYAPTAHDFAVIPDISGEYGVSIYVMPGLAEANARQNLYVTNSKENPVVFEFVYDGKFLRLSLYELPI